MDAPGFFVHPKGLCESARVGQGSRVWAFAHVLPGAEIGRDANICDFVFVENDVVLGERVTVKCHVALWDGLRVGDDVFIGPGVCFTNDKNPRSKRYKTPLHTIIGRGASLGAGAVILPGIEIGQYALVGAGAVVTRDVPPFALVTGNPARQRGLACVCGRPLARDGELLKCPGGWQGQAPSPDMDCPACEPS
ncbi:dTDP-3-amino-3,6-dideoxy-alpha-D-galactopyranose 3-N-acetyltransferase [Fundidesulfovibrio magnetotacticus]|uniref:dTDP-3-amino-3,6-dideoxy-alpha-D-galactopyranose 3-N-acetyltransferase n=1 Tax=Fundidesulfovibrio magnetotacticus TaxID=2730080 RepID=A0A6V8LMB7_9BACT|nr:acyltransferase [Fundidesulfovibrio magnetotacticus]GFK93822.1 dTDP-3-amino-3,6-dideoxy-alpha-D-galactopyranose 3-N-acetyltransferase [Fundidesulfovibrio magnetotacticus]